MDLQKLKKEIEKIKQSDINILKNSMKNSDCIFLLGNGGSSSICSHMAEDYTKTLSLTSMTFSDSAQLTCYANDYGYELAYVKWLEHYALKLCKNPLVILISSSGNSKNIINCAEFCKLHKIALIKLTGFSENNKLKILNDNNIINFWVDSNDYGIVECTHKIFLHSVI